MSVQQAPGLTRTDLQQHDLSAPGREVVQNREAIHAVRNVGDSVAAELATCVVEKSKPLVEVIQ